jgi:hypothetical protein
MARLPYRYLDKMGEQTQGAHIRLICIYGLLDEQSASHGI